MPHQLKAIISASVTVVSTLRHMPYQLWAVISASLTVVSTHSTCHTNFGLLFQQVWSSSPHTPHAIPTLGCYFSKFDRCLHTLHMPYQLWAVVWSLFLTEHRQSCHTNFGQLFQQVWPSSPHSRLRFPAPFLQGVRMSQTSAWSLSFPCWSRNQTGVNTQHKYKPVQLSKVFARGQSWDSLSGQCLKQRPLI